MKYFFIVGGLALACALCFLAIYINKKNNK
mgnify:CR=1 FL=1